MPSKGKSAISQFFGGLLPEKPLHLALFLVILAAALGLRLVGIDWGLSEDHFELSLYETETETFEFIQRIDLLKGKLDPETPRPFAWNMYIGHAVLLAADGIGLCTFDRDIKYYQAHPSELRRCFLLLRGWNILLALVGIILIFGIGKLAGGDKAGLLAMAFAATAPIHLTESHFYTHQLRICTYIALTLYLALLALKSKSARLETATAIASGLTGAVLINGIFTAITLPLLLLYNRPAHKSIPAALFSKRTVWLGAVFLCSFAFGIGGQWVRVPEFIAQSAHLNQEVFYRYPGEVGLLQILIFTLPYALGLPLFLAGLLGAGWAVKKRDPVRIMILAVFAVFFIAILAFSVSRARYGLHILPMVAVLAALFLADIRAGLSSRIGKISITFVVVCIIGLNLIYGSALLGLLNQPHNTATASAWMEENIEPKVKIGLISRFRRGLPSILEEGYFGPGSNYYPNIVSIEDQYDYELPDNLDYIVTYDLEVFGIYNKYIRFPDRFAKKAALAQALQKSPYREVAIFATTPRLARRILLSKRRPLDLSFNLVPIRIYENMNRFDNGEALSE